MPLRSYENESGVTWHECLSCEHMWHQEKLTLFTLPRPLRRQTLRG
jgi:hypothetical protein